MLKIIYIFLILVGFLAISIILFLKLSPVFGQQASGNEINEMRNSPNFGDGKFHNLVETPVQTEEFRMFKTMRDFMFNTEGRRPVDTIQNLPFNQKEFSQRNSGVTITWFGHSTALIKIGNYTILADPVFSKRTSPVSWVGTKSFQYKYSYKVEDLPVIDAIIISHDHYDHLDYKTIKKFADKPVKFYVPLGIAPHLIRWGIPEKNIESLDWWDSTQFDNQLKLVATPSRHFSGRTGMSNKTLWCSWVISVGDKSVYFSGDSGYGDHFKMIGEKYGPFDIALLECGQYNPAWKYIHMMPEQTVQASIDLKSKAMVPIHWGRFNLSLHTWKDPAQRSLKSAEQNNINIIFPEIGEIFTPEIKKDELWWKK